jgi:manganese/zinc/iron transport system permease protein
VTAAQIEVQLVAAVVAAACALPGVFLVLRRMAMMSDAIAHAILPGIVLGFFLTGQLGSPLLIAAAAAAGLVTVFLVEIITRSRLVKDDAAIGLVFPALFSVGVILIARYAGDVHLDIDAVLLGEIAFAPFDRLSAGGLDLGPRSLWTMGAMLVANAAFLGVFFKELKLATFDPALAASLGFAPVALHYALMALVSMTAVGAFDAVGSILVVALMIAPAATAWLLTDRLGAMVAWSVGLGIASAISGYWLAHALDASIAGAMATMTGVIFVVALITAPRRGLVALLHRRITQRWTFAQQLLLIHLLNHEGSAEADEECRRDRLPYHLRWPPAFATRVVRRAERQGLVVGRGEWIDLTPAGRARAGDALAR